MSIYYINYNKLDGGSETSHKIIMTEEKDSTEYREVSFYEILDICYKYKKLHYLISLVFAIYQKDETAEIIINGNKRLISIFIPKDADSNEGGQGYLNLSENELDYIIETFIVNNILFFKNKETLINEINEELLKISQLLNENLKKEQDMEEISEILNNFLKSWYFNTYILNIFTMYHDKDKIRINFDKITENVDIIMNLILYNTAKFFEICLTKINEFNLKYSFNINESNENSLLGQLIIKTATLINNASHFSYGEKIKINDNHRKIFELFFIFLFHLREIESDNLSKNKQNDIKKNKEKLIKLIKDTNHIIMKSKKMQAFDFIYQIFRSITNAIMNILINRKYNSEFSKIYEELIKNEGLLNPNIIQYYDNLKKQIDDIENDLILDDPTSNEEQESSKTGKKKKKKKTKSKIQEVSDATKKDDQTQEKSISSDLSFSDSSVEEVEAENDYKELIGIDISNQITRLTTKDITSKYIQFDDEIISFITYIGVNIFLKNDIDLDFFVHNFDNNGIEKIFKSYYKNFERLAILIKMINKNEIISANIKEKFDELLNNIAGRHNFLAKFSLISDNFSELGFKGSKLTRQISDWEYDSETTDIKALKDAVTKFNNENNDILKLKIKQVGNNDNGDIEYILIEIRDGTEDHFTFHTDLESYNKVIGRAHLKFGKQYFKYLYFREEKEWRIVERKKSIDQVVFKRDLNENQKKLVDFINDIFFKIIQLN